MIGSLEVGGAETQLVRLVNGLDRSRFQPSVLALWQGGPLQAALAPDVPVEVAHPSSSETRRRNRLRFGSRLVLGLVQALRRQRPDIVHAYLPGAFVPTALAAWSVRVPIVVAGRRGLTRMDVYGPRWRTLARLANRVIDIHVCNSNAVRDFAIAEERIPIERTRVVHNGLGLPSERDWPPLPESWRSTDATAAMVANLIGYKGHDGVVKAMARVVQKHPDFKLVLIGDGPRRAAIERLLRDLNLEANVIIAGGRADAAQLMASFDFTVLASSEEGFPNVLMESMALAVPVVSTAVGGVTELVEDGVHGRLVPFGDPGALAEALSWMIDNPEERKQMGHAGRSRIRDEFSTEHMIASTEAVYDELVSGDQKPGDRALILSR